MTGGMPMVDTIQIVCTGADPGFDQGGPQIKTGLKLPFWGLSFVEFLVLGPHFWWSGGGPGPRGPPLDPPLVYLHYITLSLL